MKIKISTLMITIFCISSALSYAKESSKKQFDLISLKKEIQLLDLSIERSFPVSTKNYFDYYNINYKNLKHFFGYFFSDQYKIASHVFLPKNPKGTIIILHGYFDHTGEIQTLINLCIQLNFSVATIDLPGHGLSSGDRGAIGDFRDYASALDSFISKYKLSLPKPLHLIGHSTGCAVAYEYLSKKKETDLNKIIFLAPLIRSNHWQSSKVSFFILKKFVKKIPRKFTKNSGNKDYLAFVEKDPVEIRYISTQWFKALYDWNKRIENYKTIKNPAIIIQGDADKTVEWKYNINFLKKKFNKLNVVIIKKGRHQLPNESQEIREKVFKQIQTFLKS